MSLTSTAPSAADILDAGLVPKGAEIVNYGHTHPIHPNEGTEPFGWYKDDYDLAVSTYQQGTRTGFYANAEQTPFEGYSIADNYSETILTQRPDDSWAAHTIRVGAMARDGYQWSRSTNVPRKYIVEGVR